MRAHLFTEAKNQPAWLAEGFLTCWCVCEISHKGSDPNPHLLTHCTQGRCLHKRKRVGLGWSQESGLCGSSAHVCPLSVSATVGQGCALWCVANVRTFEPQNEIRNVPAGETVFLLLPSGCNGLPPGCLSASSLGPIPQPLRIRAAVQFRMAVGVAQTPVRGSGDPFSSRILKHLKAKDPVQLRLEHLEQGFSVYVNGANSELRSSPRRAVHSHISRSASQAEGAQGEPRPFSPSSSSVSS